jgi:hypothetical protein
MGQARGGARPALCKMRQLTCSMGLKQMGIRIQASRVTTTRKDFTFGNPINDYHTLYNIV